MLCLLAAPVTRVARPGTHGGSLGDVIGVTRGPEQSGEKQPECLDVNPASPASWLWGLGMF